LQHDPKEKSKSLRPIGESIQTKIQFISDTHMHDLKKKKNFNWTEPAFEYASIQYNHSKSSNM